MQASDISSFSAVIITTSIIIITGRHYSVVNSGDYQVRVNPSVSGAAVLAGNRRIRSFEGRNEGVQISRCHEVETQRFGGNGEEESRAWRRRSRRTRRSLFELEPSVMRFLCNYRRGWNCRCKAAKVSFLHCSERSQSSSTSKKVQFGVVFKGRPQGGPRTCRRDYTSLQGRGYLGILQEELKEPAW